MAKQTKNEQVTPVQMNFRDVDAESVQKAQAAVQGGNNPTLKVPAGARSNYHEKSNTTYTRWSERITIRQAYRTVAKSGLLDVTLVTKVRQSADNSGATLFGHFYINLATEISDGHAIMNDKSYGALITALVATGFMPAGGTLKGSLLDKMFPIKDKPGSSSPLNGKSLIANISQEFGPQKDKNKKVILDSEGEPVMGKRDNIESFLPEAGEVEVEEVVVEGDEDEASDEDEEVEVAPARVIPAKRRK